jgi:hypothetical protein
MVWNGNVALVTANTLKESGNILRIGSRTKSGDLDGDIDEFIVDNVVLFYKTR